MSGRRGSSALAVLSVTVVFLCHLPPSLTAEVNPQTVTDSYGNAADINSTITWAALPAGEPYAGAASVNSVDGLEALYTGIRGFVNLVFSTEVPWSLIYSIVQDISILSNSYLEVAKFGAGVAACIVIGVLFIVIFPIVGCCCCCVRLCMGPPKKRPDPPTKFSGCVLIIVIALVNTLFAVGLICTYYTNERMTRALSTVVPTLTSATSDIDLYANNTLAELTYATRDTYGFTRSVINRDLDNIGPLIGGPVRTQFEALGVSSAFDSLLNLDPLVATLTSSLLAVQTSVNATETSVAVLSHNLSTVKTDLDTTLTNCGSPCAGSGIDTTQLATDFSATALPDFSSQLAGLQSVDSVNLTALVITGKAEFEGIDDNITQEAAPSVATIKTTLDTFEGSVNTSLESVEDLLAVFSNLTTNVQQIQGTLNQASEYERYRWYAGTALCCLLLLILVLHTIGTLFALFSGRFSLPDDGEPLTPTCGSSTGKNTVLASAWITFGVGALLMLLVTLTFTIGAPLDKVLCQSVQYPDFPLFVELVDGGPNKTSLITGSSGYALGDILFQDGTVAITASGLLTDCKEGRSAWTAVHLDRFINLTEATNYKKDIDIVTQINNINVDLSTIKIVEDDLKTEIANLKTNLQGVDYAGLTTELQKQTTAVDLTTFATDLTNLATTLEAATVPTAQTTTAATELRAHAATLQSIESNEAATVTSAQTQMLSSVSSLNSSSITVPNEMDALVVDLTNTETRLQTDGEQIIKNESTVYANRVLGVADQYVAYAISASTNEVGACTPIWNAYDRLINGLLCDNFVSVLNAFWFTLGWCVFTFTVDVILAFKVANRVKASTYSATSKISPAYNPS